MEPLLLVCGGCGVRIRATDLDRARGRDCPRCATPLASAVDEALRARGRRLDDATAFPSIAVEPPWVDPVVPEASDPS